MAYLNTIPTATSTLSASQPQLLENFSQLQTQLSVDHASLLAGAVPNTTGKHRKVSLPRWVSPPEAAADPVLLAATDLVLYAKLSGATTELFMRNSVGIKQITAGGTIAGFIKAFATFTAGGVIVVGSSYNVNAPVVYAGGVYTVVFTTGLSNANYTVIVTPFNNAAASYTGICTAKDPNFFKVAATRVDTYSNIPLGVLVLGM